MAAFADWLKMFEGCSYLGRPITQSTFSTPLSATPKAAFHVFLDVLRTS